MKYGVNDKPKPLEMLGYALQWFCVMISTVLVLAGVVSKLHYDDAGMQTVYTQKMFFLTALALVVQVFWGHKMPVMIGPASVLLVGILSSRNASIDAIYTAIALGGLMLIPLSFGRVFNVIQKVITPRIIIVILMLVALSLAPLVLKLSLGIGQVSAFKSFAFSLSLAFAVMFLGAKLPGAWKSMSMFFGVVAGALAYWAIFGMPPGGAPDAYKWGDLWNNLFIRPEFDMNVIPAFILCFLALFVNEVGSVYAVGALIGEKGLAEKGRRALRTTGAFNFLSGSCGVIGQVDFSTSPGVIAATGCASKYPVALMGLLVVACALVPQSIAVLHLVPQEVMGAVLFYVLAAQFASGIQMAVKEKSVVRAEDGLVIGLPVMAAICIAFAPAEFFDSMPALARPILGNGFTAGCVLALILEHIVCRRRA